MPPAAASLLLLLLPCCIPAERLRQTLRPPSLVHAHDSPRLHHHNACDVMQQG